MGSLEAHEKRMSRFSAQDLEQAFQGKVNISHEQKKQDNDLQDEKNIFAQSRGRGRGRHQNYRGRGRGRGCSRGQGGRNTSNSRSSTQDSSSYCRICRKNGHDTNRCWSKCKKCKNANHSQRDCWYQEDHEKKDANFTEKEEEDQVFYSCLNFQQVEHIWYVDSGCSNHMSGNKEMFVDLDESYSSEVKLGNGKSLKISGKGAITVQTKGGKTNVIKDVFYVPDLTQKLLSVGQLLKKNYKVEFDNDICIIIDKQRKYIVAKIKMSQNKVFPFHLQGSQKVLCRILWMEIIIFGI
ncbi:UNVERIFIED_CONTAM: hypothetical protein Slati_0085700 [Sesamum latifolium]|uniref:Retrovirus-related Pol polyprotein from transposon TNT 1-94-like beta-barrel domain-containing protein n=1 Tax=Sesamum latifolium TaxID=2727402 RepID=A0AAW2Y853_9LAMI